MTKQKSTKRALLMSALSLLMCVSMLVGSTFAWFTDSVTSGNNKIVAGTLDIDLYKINDLWGMVMGTDGAVEEITDSSTPLFGEDILWEPAYEAVANLQLVNNGNLALKWQAIVRPVADIGELAEVIDVYVSEDELVYTPNGRETYQQGKLTKVGTLRDVMNGKAILSGAMEKQGDVEFFSIVLKMQETAGNEYQGKSAGAFDITILATQYTYENDSFDNQYDKDAVYGDVMVSTDAELKAAIEDPDMKVIAVNGDLTYDWGGKSYENSAALLMKGKTFLGATGADSITFAGYGSANPIVDATFRNITIKDSTVGDNEASWEHGHLEFENLTALNVTFANTIMLDGDNSLTNCVMNNTVSNWYGIWIEGGNTVIKDCSFRGTRSVKIHEAYGSNVESVVIDNCVFGALSEKPGVVIGDLDATTKVTIKNSTFVNCQAGDQSEYIYESDTDVTTFKFVNENNKIIRNATIVSSAEEFIAATNGGLVVITDDIVYTNTDPSKQMIMEAVNAIEFNGNGATITTQGADPSVGNHGYVAFVPAAGQNVTVTDVTITGEGFVEMGDYSIGGGNYVANNLVVKDLVSTLANGDKGKTLACGFAHYGNAELNNCTMTGTTAMIDGAMAVDAGFVNGTTTVVNGGEYGTVYCWSHAKVTINGAEVDTLYVSPINGNVTIKAGTHIATLNVDYGTSSANATRLAKLVIEDGATVDAIVFNGTSYTVAEWNAYLATL